MGYLRHAPIEELQVPCDGAVMIDRYWCVHPDKGAAFWDRGGRGSLDLDRLSPQCNSDKLVSDRLVHIHPGHVIQKIPVVYCGNLHRIIDASE